MQLAIEFGRSRGDKFVYQVVKPICLHNEPCAAQLLTKRIDNGWELLWPG